MRDPATTAALITSIGASNTGVFRPLMLEKRHSDTSESEDLKGHV